MILNLLIWIDLHVLRCHWKWFCGFVWDRQIRRDWSDGCLQAWIDRGETDDN